MTHSEATSDHLAATAPHGMTDGRKPVVLVFVGWPDTEASGALRSVLGMTEALADVFDFKIVTRLSGTTTRPAGSPAWEPFGSAQRYVIPNTAWWSTGVGNILRKTPHDLVMLSGLFDREFTLKVLLGRKLRRIPNRPAILSPFGECAPGALSLKARVKRCYVAMLRAAGLLSDVFVHASDEKELRDIRKVLPFAKGYRVANDISPQRAPLPHAPSPPGTMRLIFIGRITRVKNVQAAITALADVKARVRFDIHGPIEDAGHWRDCKTAIAKLPPNVTVVYRGELANSEIEAAFGQADLFFMPSLGENFGHAIFEALSCGVPVLISDRTPWRNLAAEHAGWELPLDDMSAFARAIDTMAAMSRQERDGLRRGARTRAERFVSESDAIARRRAMLDDVLGKTAMAD